MYDICSMLTKKQKNLLMFINKKLRSSGVSPSYEEMKQSLNLKSKSGIHRLISALEIKISLLTTNLDLDYIETLIRDKFLFGKEGEKVYIINNED